MKNVILVSPIDMEARKSMDLRAGDTVRVWQKIEEKGKYRLQAFEGLVLARKHGTEAGGTFTVRRVASGVGVEKIFPLYSPMIDSIEVLRRAKVRRAKLYYIRDKASREARRAMRKSMQVSLSTTDMPEDIVPEAAPEPEELKEELTTEAPEVTA